MSTERFFIADPYNDEHIRMIAAFEEANGITTVTSTLLRNIRQTRIEDKYKEEVKESNEIHQSLFLQEEDSITDTCHIQAEKDMKSCRIFFAPISSGRNRKLIPLATDYAFDVLGMEDVFVALSSSGTEQELAENLENNGYENLGENEGSILYLKEKQFTQEQERKNTMAA